MKRDPKKAPPLWGHRKPRTPSPRAYIYWHDGRAVRVGDRFRSDPIYKDNQVYEVTAVSPKWVDFRGVTNRGVRRAWGSDFFEPGGICPRDGLGPNQGIWTRV